MLEKETQERRTDSMRVFEEIKKDEGFDLEPRPGMPLVGRRLNVLTSVDDGVLYRTNNT
jgi:hypothetical protein